MMVQPVQAFELTALKIVGSAVAGMVAYLPVALLFMIPREKEREHAGSERDEAESHLRVEGTVCAQNNLKLSRHVNNENTHFRK